MPIQSLRRPIKPSAFLKKTSLLLYALYETVICALAGSAMKSIKVKPV